MIEQMRDYAYRKSIGKELYPIVRQCVMINEWADQVDALQAREAKGRRIIAELLHEVEIYAYKDLKHELDDPADNYVISTVQKTVNKAKRFIKKGL